MIAQIPLIAGECMGVRCQNVATVRVDLGDYVGLYCAGCAPSRAMLDAIAASDGVDVRVSGIER